MERDGSRWDGRRGFRRWEGEEGKREASKLEGKGSFVLARFWGDLGCEGFGLGWMYWDVWGSVGRDVSGIVDVRRRRLVAGREDGGLNWDGRHDGSECMVR
ncbi:hypothetical protein J1614_010758 [Plenodomus biglobosus]|nr:hypothetical protein J1614_010758 [Plenodomus biglobosus]